MFVVEFEVMGCKSFPTAHEGRLLTEFGQRIAKAIEGYCDQYSNVKATSLGLKQPPRLSFKEWLDVVLPQSNWRPGSQIEDHYKGLYERDYCQERFLAFHVESRFEDALVEKLSSPSQPLEEYVRENFPRWEAEQIKSFIADYNKKQISSLKEKKKS